MNEIYDLEIHCSNENGGSYKYNVDCDDIYAVTRALLTFRPKRNYKVIEVFCSLSNRLV